MSDAVDALSVSHTWLMLETKAMWAVFVAQLCPHAGVRHLEGSHWTIWLAVIWYLSVLLICLESSRPIGIIFQGPCIVIPSVYCFRICETKTSCSIPCERGSSCLTVGAVLGQD